MPQIEIGVKTFKTQKDCEEYTREILKEMKETDSVKNKNEEYFSFLLSLCKRHPRYLEKLSKFSDFKIYKDALNKRALAIKIVNNDNTYTEISWRTCVTGKHKNNKTLFNSALRQCISYQIKFYRDTTDLSVCMNDECRTSLTDKTIHIDHAEPQFIKLVENFLEENKEKITEIPNDYNKTEITFETLFKDKDEWIGRDFAIYHEENAKLRVLCEKCNLTRKKYKPIDV